MRTPLNSCEALAEEIKRLAVSLFTQINIQMTLKRWQESMCIAGFGCGLVCAACNTYALCVAAFNARWQKTFMLKSLLFYRHSRTRRAGPGERGLERLFTHNVKLYNLCGGMCVTNPNFNTKPETPRWRLQRMCAMTGARWLT